jgi:Terpene cyclase DEP1
MREVRKGLYLALCAGGTLLAWYHGVQWIAQWTAAGGNLLNVPAFFFNFFRDSFVPNPAASFVTVDLIGSWFTFLVFVLPEAKRLGMRHGWAYFVAASTIGTCFALPLFLYNRERRMAETGV